MRKLFLLLCAVIVSASTFGQLTGIKTVPGDYATLELAIAALNSQGVGSGGVTFNVAAGYTETFTTPVAGIITATGTVADPIIFIKDGAGSNPVITAGVGTTTTTDGIIKIAGGDYITFDGINLAENAANLTATTQMEWGYALVKGSAAAPFNGCQNVTIRNCSVTLNKVNTASVGIYAGNHIATATTSLTITAATDAMNNCKFYSNTISNSYIGIQLKGFAAASPYTLYDANNEIGVGGANAISNYGGGSATAYGIYAIYQLGLLVSNNTVNGGSGTTTTLYGIFLSTGASANVSYNTVTIAGGGTTSAISGISNAMGYAAYTVNINNNTVQNCTYTTATSGDFNGIVNSGLAGTNNINNNVVTGCILPGTGAFYGIYNSGSNGTNPLNFFGNQVSGNQKTGASGAMYCMRAVTSSVNFYNNSIYSNSCTGSGSFYGYYNGSSPVLENYYSNVIHDLTQTGTGTVYGIQISTAAGLKNTYSNQIYNLTATGGTVYGIGTGYGAPHNIYKNNIYNLSGNAAGSLVYGIYISGGTTMNVYNNFVSDLKTPAGTGANAVNGIYFSGGTTVGAYYNTVYLNATSSGATFGSTGIYKSSTSTGDFKNNLIMNLSTPGTTSGFTVAFRWSGAYNAAYYTAGSNANNFYAGTPATNRLVFYDGTNSDQTIASYQTRVAPRDAGSFSENSPLLNAATAPFDLHMNTTVATFCESGGVVVSSPAITDDFDGTTRTSNPDVGADEFTGIAAGVINPGAFTATAVNSSQINLTFTLNPAGDNVLIVWNATGTFTTPVGSPPAVGGSFAGGTVLSLGMISPVNHTGLTAGTPYYYKAFSYNGTNYSFGVTGTATPGVAPPTAFTATPVSTSEIDLAWALNASGHDVVVATSLTSTFGTPVNGTPLNVNDPITGGGTVIFKGTLTAFNHTSLATASTHYYKAWSVDGAVYYSSTGATVNAATLCPPAFTPTYSQNFEGANFPPNCWTRATGTLAAPTTLSGTSSNWIQDDYRNVTAPVDKAAKLNIYGTSLYAWLITPAIDLGSSPSTYQLEFDLSLNAYGTSTAPATTGVDDKFAIVISTDGGTTWTSANTLRLYDNAGSPFVYNNINFNGEHITLSLAAYTGIVKIGFYGESTVSNADNDLMINNLFVQLPPTCLPPTGLTVSGVTNSDATIGWANAATVQIDYGTAGHVAGTGTIIPGISTNPYLLNGLGANTTYDVYIRQDCGSSGLSNWAGPIQFTTQCDGVNSFTQNFDGVTTPALPSCWLKIGTAGYAYTQTTTPFSSPNCVYMVSYSTVAPFAVLAMPPVKNAASGTNQLRFMARGSTAVGGILEVGYLTNPSDPSSFTLIQSNTINSLTYTEYIVYPGTAPGSSNVLAFRHIGSTQVLIDNVNWEPLPTCPAPNTLSASHITTNSATLGWNEPGSATAWEFVYGIAPLPAPTGSGTTATSTTVPISGLTEGATYQFYVRSNCGTEFSTWSGPASFFTGYCTPAPTSVDGIGITNVTFSTVNNTTVAEPGNYGNYSAMVGVVQQTVTTPVSITFATGYTYDTKIWIDWNDNLVFTDPGEEVYSGTSTNANPTTLAASFVTPISAPLGNHRMRIGGVDAGPPTPCYASTYGTFEDYTVNVTAAPACLPPSSLAATLITQNSANLTWTPLGTETAWEYVYGLSPLPAPAGAGTATTSSTINPISGLTASSVYQFYVRANCGSSFSTWSGPYTFTTSCGSVTLPYTQNFDAVTAPAIPNCMTVTNDNSDAVAWVTSTSNTPRSLPNGMRISYNTTMAMNDWFFTPPLSLAAGTYSVSFWYKSSGASYPEKLEVKWGSAPNAAGMTNGPIFDNNNITSSTFTEGTGTITVLAAGDYYVGWHGYSAMDMYYIMVDDITIFQPLAHDVSTVSVDIPTMVAAGTFTPKATVMNNGTNTETFPVTMTIGTYTSTKTVTALAPGASEQVTFDSWMTEVGAYSAQVCTGLVGDLNAANDCKTKTGTVEVLTKFYAYNAYDPTAASPEGPGYFYKEHPNVFVSLAPTTSAQFISAGTWANGTWYGSEYYDNTVTPPSGGGWYTINPTTGSMTKLADLAKGFTGITYDHIAGIMYGVEWNGTTNNLYSIIPATGASTLIGTVGGSELLINLATDGSGFLYSLGVTTSHLFKINPVGPSFVDVGAAGVTLSYAQDMEYDYASNTMYAAAYTTTGSLYTVNLTTGACTLVSAFQGGSELTGFAIPYQDAAPLGLTGTVTNVTGCFGNSNGAISTTVTGGVSPYTYTWSNAATTASLSGIPAGTYAVTVTDAVSGHINGSWTVTQPSSILLTAITANASCPSEPNGSIDLTVSGGTTGYVFLWSNGATTEDISGVIPGTYTVTVTDAALCIKTGSWIVDQVSAVCPNISVNGEVTTTVCYNATNTITVAGGVTLFTVVAPNGNATFIAGVNILFEPGTSVQSGAYMHGYISTTYCTNPSTPIVATGTGNEEPTTGLSMANFNLYPNPTNGNFTLQQKGDRSFGTVKVEVFSMNGAKVLTEQMVGEKRHEFSFSSVPAGLYFVKVVADEYVETIKLIKTR